MNVLRVGRYRLLQRLGSGASSEVYLAEDMSLQRKVALKLLRRREASAEQIREFQAEARCAAMLNHPNIVTVFDVGSEGELHYIATEYIEGETLRQRIVRGAIPLSQVIDISIGVAQALVAAHEAWIVHRDIKPENVMLRRDGGVKVLDFSVSRLAGGANGEDTLRRPGGLAGTLHYLSPEQVRGESIIDTRSDIYSFGIVLYEMLAGDPPFTGEAMDVLARIVEADPPPLPGTTPLALHSVVTKAIRKDMYERWQTAAEVLDQLNEFRIALTLHSRKPQSMVIIRDVRGDHTNPIVPLEVPDLDDDDADRVMIRRQT